MAGSVILENVWFRYRHGSAWVLKNINLSIRPGSVVAIVGPNGAGKSTLLKVAGLIYKPQRGRVLIGGVDAWSSDSKWLEEIRLRIVYVHEVPIMLRGRVIDNLLYPLRIRTVDNDVAKRKIKEVSDLLGISSLLKVNASRLSAGQAKLVALARALVAGPEYLLLDEPCAHLDRMKRDVLKRAISSLIDEGASVVIATHNLRFAVDIGASFFELDLPE